MPQKEWMSEYSRNRANPKAKGRLTVYLGYAAGTGKTFRMLEEAQKLKQQGCDIAIGYFEPHGRKDTIAKTEGLETIPRRAITYKGTTFEEMDTRAILDRAPAICVIDEFAHTNVPGSDRAKRWEDVMLIQEAGIDVLTTLNVQHIESLNDHVWQVTGIRVRETVPDWVVRDADELVMVDVTPRALVHRLERGVVYAPEKAKNALANFFTEANLTALRELALRQAAHQVEERREENVAARVQSAKPEVRSERLLLHLTDDPSTAGVIRRGKRVADYLHADCYAVYVARDPDLADLSADKREAVERHIGFASNLHIATCTMPGRDVAKSLAEFAREHRITQLFLARTSPDLERIIDNARDLEVTVVAERQR
jgi:two-component system sensor histidine kinase KdpD